MPDTSGIRDGRLGDERASRQGDMSGIPEQPILSLVFAAGRRPDLASLVHAGRLAEGCGLPFSVTHDAVAEEGWAELLTSGLAFDCHGVAPAAPADLPEQGARLGLDEWPAGEAMALMPGPHLADGAAMLPVLRGLVGIGARLAKMEGIRAVCWSPAQTWMEPEFFVRVADAWLAGGAFPALGLTMLRQERNGGLHSQGLGFLIGQELRMEPDRKISSEVMAQLAMRLIDRLVEEGPLPEAREFALDDTATLLAVPVAGGSELRVMRRANGGS